MAGLQNRLISGNEGLEGVVEGSKLGKDLLQETTNAQSKSPDSRIVGSGLMFTEALNIR